VTDLHDNRAATRGAKRRIPARWWQLLSSPKRVTVEPGWARRSWPRRRVGGGISRTTAQSLAVASQIRRHPGSRSRTCAALGQWLDGLIHSGIVLTLIAALVGLVAGIASTITLCRPTLQLEWREQGSAPGEVIVLADNVREPVTAFQETASCRRSPGRPVPAPGSRK
jgi:hypothetical protein